MPNCVKSALGIGWNGLKLVWNELLMSFYLFGHPATVSVSSLLLIKWFENYSDLDFEDLKF